ncbi:type 2 lantipeptide synthetase LanM family protein [Clostridium perfringens]|uniref:type 2 lanthipeptide synthetase LanM family protein n=1 Tax=Clostridium perfringens TaxID=1502 RepID=UPI0018E414F7|nr:type 2 lanthipeptide synthetase LanM family protein [Clostridium perfringens]MBI6030478.1 type 2 lantipeptide synthetase LanM family protein [Clostridium perfringens]MBI6033672.1 type 2 lantipeptide synthetase LanM family protein [Clostridium perfringens]
MNRIFEDFENEDVINYWSTLFPNIKTRDKVIEHIEHMLDIPLEKCGNEDLFYEYLTSHVNEDIQIQISNEQKKQIREYLKNDEVIVPVYPLYENIIYKNIGKLLNVIENSKIIKNKSYFTCNIISQLNGILGSQFIRTLVLELNCAREDGILKGDDSHQRYEYFINNILNDNEYKENFYKEYNSLLYVATEIIQNFFDYVQEILINTESEMDKLNQIFSDNVELGEIKDIKLSEGDTHCNGKSVTIINFTNSKIVYKPRNMEIDLSFQRFLKWVNSKNIIHGMQLSTIKIHTLNNYGWTEYIEQQDCDNKEKADKFYTKSGFLLGILYCFNAVDFHFENIIAHGENPILIDLETLFHPEIKDKISKNKNSGFQVAADFINKSVTKIGLLPTKMVIKKDNGVESIDVGALSKGKEQNNILKSLIMENINTDNLRLVYKNLPVASKKNAPKLSGESLNPKDYMENILKGFKAFYQFAQKNREEVLDYIVDNFKECQIRIILKSTITYTSLLSIASHPDFMRTPIHRLILLSKIGANDYYNLPIKQFELSELCRSQVPYFYTYFESHDIQGYPNMYFRNNIEKNIKEVLTDKFNNLSTLDMQTQINFIKDAFFVRDAQDDVTGISFDYNPNLNVRPNDWIIFAEEIAEHILSRSFIGTNDDMKTDRAYIGAQTLMTENNDWNLNIDNIDLYDGNSGIALFFAYLWKITKNEKYYRCAFETIQSIIYLVSKRNEANYKSAIGAYKGVGGLVYTINKIAVLTQDSTLEDCILGLYDIIEQNILQDVNYDFIGGGIGCLAALLAIYEKPYNDVVKDRAVSLSIKIYKFLSGKFISNKYGKVINLNKERICSGFAHGTSSFAPYLYKLYKITSDNEILELVQDILKYERNIFYTQDIPGWHSSITKDEMDVSWCNGVAGILLGKLLLKEYGYHDDLIDDEIKLSFDLVLKSSLGHNITYCHGDVSVLGIIRYYSKLTNNKQLEMQCINVFQQLYECIKDNWKEPKKTLNKYNGLMLGASGLGYAMLKQYDYENIDEFLWLV